MEIKVSRSDVIWSYVAQFFNLATGLITLPVILKLLSADEVGFNYILISINSIVVLFDLGFSGQFSRYLTYIFSGAQTIEKEGISSVYDNRVNEHLLACTIKTAKRIYWLISLLALVALLLLGTLYIYKVTQGFSLVSNTLIIWGIFCASCFFNVYFLYYNVFLQGRGLVKESRQAQILSRICQILLIFILLFAGYGLMAVVTANLISPFVFRIFSHKKFYTPEIKAILINEKVTSTEVKEVFTILFYNAKKMGFINILSSAIGYASTLVIGGYLSLAEVGSYGLLVQLTGIIAGISMVHFTSITPRLSSLMVMKDNAKMKEVFGMSMFFFYCIMILGCFALFAAVPILKWFEFNTQLPSFLIIGLYYLYAFNERNQSLFSQLFLLENDMRFFPAAIWTGVISFLALWLSLYLGYGLLGVVLAQSLPLYAYSAWKWPNEAIRVFEISLLNDIIIKPIKKIL